MKTPLEDIAQHDHPVDGHGIVYLLLKDHTAMKKLMATIKSQRSSDAKIKSTYKKLIQIVRSHVKAEERTLLNLIKTHPRFKDMSTESYEEHRVHEYVIHGIAGNKEPNSKVEQMKAFCEILEHHLKEEERDLFPRFKKYAAKSTRQKLGKRFLKVRQATKSSTENLGAARVKIK
jgi:hemerythrin superfamily protein